MIDFEYGKKLVNLARSAVEKSIKTGSLTIEKIEDETLKEKTGVFVTLLSLPQRSLRGCVGFPLGEFPLFEAVQKAAFSAAFEDDRFSKLKEEELKKVIFEVSVLTKPESIQVKDPDEYAKKIEIGKDGLIFQNGPFYGLLLPQVPLEFKWDAEEFLDNLCFKAGVTTDWIYDEDTRLWKFQSQIFSEKKPKGEIVEIRLSEHTE